MSWERRKHHYAASLAGILETPEKVKKPREFIINSKIYASLPNRSNDLWLKKSKENAQVRQMVTVNLSQSTDTTTTHSFGGISNNLSSESIKKVCDYYDDEISDDDLIEVHNTPVGFNQNQSTHLARRTNHPISMAMEHCTRLQTKSTDQHSVWLDTNDNRHKKSDCLLSTPDDTLSVLNELDAILDIHDTSHLNVSVVSNTSGDASKVEDYLLDLDNYLEEIDKNVTRDAVTNDSITLIQRNSRMLTLPINKRRKNTSLELDGKATECTDIELDFNRNRKLRKTFSCVFDRQPRVSEGIAEPTSSIVDVWRRTSSISKAIEIADEFNAKVLPNISHTTKITVDSANESHNMLNLNNDRTADLECEIRRCYSEENCAVAQPTVGNHHAQMLTEQHIFDNLLQNESLRSALNCSRPRQFGRRAEGHPLVMTIISETPGCAILTHHECRPMSAPAHAGSVFVQRSVPESYSDLSSIHCSRISSPVSVSSSNDSSSTATSTNEQINQHVTIQENQPVSMHAPLDPDGFRLREKCGFNSEWPHVGSRILALIGCTLGLFNICRFAILTINYGGNFLLQFLLLSVVFGIPLFWLQMCLGTKIKAGPVSMWKISPICSGIGIALVMVQCFIAIYSTVSVAWLLVYLCDTIPSNVRKVYRWQEESFANYMSIDNSTTNLTGTVADYFNILVLQRLQFAKRSDGVGVRFHVNDRLAFYLALIWSAVFLVLCRGLKSLGKMVFIIFILPLIALVAITGKFLQVVDPKKLQNIFSTADFDDFLVNSKTWTAATQETFLTWGLLGASVVAITSRTHARIKKHSLRCDAILIVLITFLGLSLSALLGMCSVQILNQYGYIYAPGSFENPDTYTAVYSLKLPISNELISFPHQLMPHYSSFIGETYRRPNIVVHRESGYQALRFITEIFPVVLSLSSDSISWVWAAVAFAMFALFGLAQLCVMWKPISSALGNSTSSVLLSCVTGLLLSIPFATEMGISILYYMDFLLGGAWFIPIIWTAQIFGVFLIRGRPYNGDDLVNDLRMSASMSAFLALSWNVLLPIGLITLSVIDYKASLSNQFYYWRGKSYFSYWTRKVGSLIQIGLLLIIPITAIIQIYRYLTNGPPDVLERIQLLYRPLDQTDENNRPAGRTRNANRRNLNNNNSAVNNEQQIQNDAPPKYTPPPSYTTATGARLAKLLRQSIRRSVRRVLGESSRARPTISIDEAGSNQNAQNAPPDYLTILTNPNGNLEANHQEIGNNENIEIGQRPGVNSYSQRSQTLGRKLFQQKQQRHANAGQRSTLTIATLETGHNSIQRLYTAEDVVTILRSSARNRQVRSSNSTHPPIRDDTNTENTFRSIENLVLNAEPPDQTPGVGINCFHNDHDNDNNNTSVI